MYRVWKLVQNNILSSAVLPCVYNLIKMDWLTGLILIQNFPMEIKNMEKHKKLNFVHRIFIIMTFSHIIHFQIKDRVKLFILSPSHTYPVPRCPTAPSLEGTWPPLCWSSWPVCPGCSSPSPAVSSPHLVLPTLTS